MTFQTGNHNMSPDSSLFFFFGVCVIQSLRRSPLIYCPVSAVCSLIKA